MKSFHSLTILLALGVLAAAAEGDTPPAPAPAATPAPPRRPANRHRDCHCARPGDIPRRDARACYPATTPPTPAPHAPVMVRQPYRPAVKAVPKKAAAKPPRKPAVKKAAKPVPNRRRPGSCSASTRTSGSSWTSATPTWTP